MVVVISSSSSAGASSAMAKRCSWRASVTGPAVLAAGAVIEIAMRRSALQDLCDPGLRLIQRFLGLLLAHQRGLDRGRHRVADGGPLRHARTPFDIGVLLQRL